MIPRSECEVVVRNVRMLGHFAGYVHDEEEMIV